jgi:hypothetical protein
MFARETIPASARRIVTIALQEAATRGHRDFDIDEMICAACDSVLPQRKKLLPTSPLFAASPVTNENANAQKHIGVIINVIHQKDLRDIQRIVSMCLMIEMSAQLRLTGHRQAASAVSTMMAATA